MCGIVAYVGRKVAQPLLIEGLKRLEYRGYDSAGIAVIDDRCGLHIRRAVGRISVLESALAGDGALPPAKIGMAHTRWATHGAPTEVNAHPHTNADKTIAVVHNGIVENHIELRDFLRKQGYEFASETDTEVIPLLLDYFLQKTHEPRRSFLQTLELLRGSYAVVALFHEEPGVLYAAKLSSP